MSAWGWFVMGIATGVAINTLVLVVLAGLGYICPPEETDEP